MKNINVGKPKKVEKKKKIVEKSEKQKHKKGNQSAEKPTMDIFFFKKEKNQKI